MIRRPDITSTRNERVRAAAGLARRKQREAEGRYLIEGPNAVVEALQDGAVLDVFATPGAVDAVAPSAASAGVAVTVVTDRVLRRLSGTVTPQGIVAVARMRATGLDAVVGRGVLVVLCAVADPGNAGTAIRTADAAGAAGVVLTRGSVDPYNPKSVRAAAGSLTHVPVVAGPPAGEVLARCHSAAQTVVALDPTGDLRVGCDPLPPQPCALVFGSEAHGLPPHVREDADVVAAVPLFGRAESLNLAAAVAVATYAAAWAGRGCDPAGEGRSGR